MMEPKNSCNNEASSIVVSGIRVDFPCKPYSSQIAMMSKIIQGLKNGKNCLLEAPTGSGKSLALLCAALAWQRVQIGEVSELSEEPKASKQSRDSDGNTPVNPDQSCVVVETKRKQRERSPKIFFGTRTHKQISQITRELRKTSYREARCIVLASRDHTCINPLVEKLESKNEACKELLRTAPPGCAWHAGAKKLANFGALEAIGLPAVFDLEDLVAEGRKHRACPYFVTRLLVHNAEIIFCPYNYLIDPKIRKSMNIELTGNVLIFDEAHNIEDASRDSSSFSIKQEDIKLAIQNCERVSEAGLDNDQLSELSTMLSTISQWIDMQLGNLTEKSRNKSEICLGGEEFLGSIEASGISKDTLKSQLRNFSKMLEKRVKQREGEKGLNRSERKPTLAPKIVDIIENIFRMFRELCQDNGRYQADYRVVISQDTVQRCRTGYLNRTMSVQVITLHLWCLNPAIAFEPLKNQAHSIILTSGTLSPMQSFESELGVSFPLKLEASHVIDKMQCWAAVVGSGPTGGSMNGSFLNVAEPQYQDELGLLVQRVCQIMPHGVLCFFPSYTMLENVTARWRENGVLNQMKAVKTVVTEPRSGTALFNEEMKRFNDAIHLSTMQIQESTVTGALFLAVCRGKVSEGLDFADNNARAVICVGIPFPNFTDTQIELKREYNNTNSAKGLLSGSEWYEIQAFRAVNQALGRCIRHRNDWGAILLVDERYIRQPRYVSSLPKWIRSSVQKFTNWPSCESGLLGFREQMKKHNNIKR